MFNLKNKKKIDGLDNSEALANKDFAEKIATIKDVFGESSDFQIHMIGSKSTIEISIMYFQTLADQKFIEELYVKEITKYMTDEDFQVKKIKSLFSSEIRETKEVIEKLLEGNAIILISGIKEIFVAKAQGGERRSVSEPINTSLVRGSHEAFNESLYTNIGLLRKRINNEKFRVEVVKIGEVTNTSVAIVYLKEIAKEELVEEVKRRLHSIQLDSVLESSYIQECLEDEYHGYTPFPTMYDTELPDQIAGGLLEGRIGILTEGTPIALLAPVTLNLFLSSNEDYYQRFDIASFLRILRLITFLFSILLPAFYIVLLTYHQEVIPTPLLIALTGQREGVPFSVAIEVILMELTFEILREAGLRLPKSVGSAVSIVGGLVLGQAAVEAGLVGAATVITVALTAISSFCTPSFSIAISARLIRFALILLGAGLGGFGLMFGLIFVFVHLNTLRSLGVPYLAPLIPFHKNGIMDTLYRAPMKNKKYRPEEFVGENNEKK